MNHKKLPLMILKIGILFLFYSAYTDFIRAEYWRFYTDLEFIGIGLYILFIYPKRKLQLNSDFLIILFLHFSALSINSFLTQNWIIMITSLSACLGYVAYRIYRKKHKYSFYIHR